MRKTTDNNWFTSCPCGYLNIIIIKYYMELLDSYIFGVYSNTRVKFKLITLSQTIEKTCLCEVKRALNLT